MGTFFNQVFFKGPTPDEVASVIRSKLPRSDCFVTTGKNACVTTGKNVWVTVLDRDCNKYYTGEPVVSLAHAVCCAWECPAISFSVIHSDYLCYYVFDHHGEVVDQSCPEDDREPLTYEEQHGLLGNPEHIAALAITSGVTAEAVRLALSAGEEGCMELSVQKVTRLLGITDFVPIAYKDLLEFVDELAPEFVHPITETDWRDEFIHISPDDG